jgi:hypothetical protein
VRKDRGLARTPPTAVLHELRREVGFSCPVSGSGNPYLSWHHFDPPWRQEKHHRPQGLVALCLEHARKADGGAFTLAQIREFTRCGADGQNIVGKFDWLRYDMLVVVGSGFFYKQDVIFAIDGRPSDFEGHL